ncbi:hypothetical protein SAVIM40S_00045 [Streptomyces avidinii]
MEMSASRAAVISCARRAMSSSTAGRELPDSRLSVISAFALSHRCWRCEPSYSRALSIATPAATERVAITVSSSVSKSIPPRLSVR